MADTVRIARNRLFAGDLPRDLRPALRDLLDRAAPALDEDLGRTPHALPA